MAVRCPYWAHPTDPAEGIVGLGTTEGAEMCSCAIRMGADSRGATDVVIDTDFFSVRSTEATVGDLRPRWLAIREFGCRVPVGVMFADRVVEFTAEDAADRVTLSAAVRK